MPQCPYGCDQFPDGDSVCNACLLARVSDVTSDYSETDPVVGLVLFLTLASRYEP